MKVKATEKELAISLRKQGKTYSEILERVPVAKSTLSLWLRDVGLAKKQQHRITAKKHAAQVRGAQVRRTMRLETMHTIHNASRKEVGRLSERERWLVGATLYWAEGTKERLSGGSQPMDFANMDPAMIRFYVDWVCDMFGIPNDRIKLSLYIHENHKYRVQEVIKYWEKVIGRKGVTITYTYFKKHKPKTVRKRVSETNYFGTLRVSIGDSIGLQRKIQGWIYGITGSDCPIV